MKDGEFNYIHEKLDELREEVAGMKQWQGEEVAARIRSAKEEVAAGLKKAEGQREQILAAEKLCREVVLKLDHEMSSPREDSVMFSKTPFRGASCASCEKNLVNIFQK